MKKQNMVLSAIVLTVASFVTRIMGFGFRIYLSNTIKAEGMGLYQLILSLYTVVISLASSGISIAVSRLVSEDLARPEKANPRKIVKMAVGFTAVISITIGVFLFVLAEPLGTYILKDARTGNSLAILAAGIPFISISSAIKGYFLAVRKAVTTAFSNIFEEGSKIIFTVILFLFFTPNSIEQSCLIVVLGMTIGEGLSCLFLAGSYFLNIKKQPEHPVSRKGIIKTIAGIVAPITVSSGVTSTLRLAENVLIISGLAGFYADSSYATGIYGILKGMVMPLMFFPTTLLSSLVSTLIPEVSRANALENRRLIVKTVSRVMQFTLLLGILLVSIFLIFPQELGTAVYNDDRVGEMLRFLSVLCPFMYLEMVTHGILHALGEQNSPMRYNIIDSCLRIALIFVFVPRFGMTGFLWIMVFSNLFTSILNLRKLLKVTGISFRLGKWFLKPSLAAISSGFAIKILCSLFLANYFTPTITLVIGVCALIFAYFVLLFPLECITSHDISFLKSAFFPAKKKI